MFDVFAQPRKFAPPRKFAARALAALSILWLAACEPVGVSLPAVGQERSIDTSRPVPVALLVPRSDEGAASIARDLETAARLAVDDLGDVAIDLRVYDTAGDAGTAASVAQRAADEGAGIILGPLFGEAANAAAVQVADDGLNVLSFSNNSSIAGGNLFVLGPTFENAADRLVAYAARQGRTRSVIVHPDTVEGQFGRNAIESAAAAQGMRVVGTVPFPFSEEGAVDAASRAVEAVRSNDADSIFLTSTSSGALPLLAQLLPEQGLDPSDTQYIGLARWDVPQQTLDLPGVQGGWFARPDEAMMESFRDRFETAHGRRPHPLAGLAYDGIAAIGALVEQGNGATLTRGDLTQSSGFQGTGGAFRLLPDGTNQRALAVATVRDGQVEILDPAPRSFRGAGF
ncbi:penicillin-binding protein activator [Rhodosalinus sp.]|uniref:penicillin-binding protein activator n=1 Tax=Rhodosalinus sp. TaxID=2047741 RepID=UPI00397B9F72